MKEINGCLSKNPEKAKEGGDVGVIKPSNRTLSKFDRLNQSCRQESKKAYMGGSTGGNSLSRGILLFTPLFYSSNSHSP